MGLKIRDSILLIKANGDFISQVLQKRPVFKMVSTGLLDMAGLRIARYGAPTKILLIFFLLP